MRIEEQVTVARPRGEVFAYLQDPGNYLDFMEGISRWDVQGKKKVGKGARYEMRMKVGTAFVGGLIEIVEFDEGRELAWTSITGIDQRGRWRLRSRKGGSTDVLFRLSFTVPGGLLSRLTERVAGRAVAANVVRSLDRLRDNLEDGTQH